MFSFSENLRFKLRWKKSISSRIPNCFVSECIPRGVLTSSCINIKHLWFFFFLVFSCTLLSLGSRTRRINSTVRIISRRENGRAREQQTFREWRGAPLIRFLRVSICTVRMKLNDKTSGSAHEWYSFTVSVPGKSKHMISVRSCVVHVHCFPRRLRYNDNGTTTKSKRHECGNNDRWYSVCGINRTPKWARRRKMENNGGGGKKLYSQKVHDVVSF